MSQQNIDSAVSFQPLPEHSTIQMVNLLAKIAARTTISANGCWEWNGSRTGSNYGNLTFNKKHMLIHRLVFSLCVGPISKSIFVCHKCDNPPCCHPDHLFSGSPKDNTKDMYAKGRAGLIGPKGESHPNSRFTNEDVISIRHRYKQGASVRGLAREYGCSPTAIRWLIHGKGWKHIS